MTGMSETRRLERTLNWIDTMVQRRDLDEEVQEVAEVIARRKLDEAGSPIPKRL